MRVDEFDLGGGVPLSGYGPGFFRVGNEIHYGAVAVLPGRAERWNLEVPAAQFAEVADHVDIVLLGTGKDRSSSIEHLLFELESHGMSVETMTTPAACRTYNVLLAEGRRVALALLPM